MEAEIGVVGLAVMGQNLVLNMEDHGFTVAVYNRSKEKTEEFVQGSAKGKKIVPAYSLKELFAKLKRPRKVLLMVKAGSAVDAVIAEMAPFLEKGDIVIDGGNSFFYDTERRVKALKEKGILFIGSGVSGGEEGARFGPSIMPGGAEEGWKEIQPIFQAIAAKAEDGRPCCSWVGLGGAGHYVKMVHNGIEYGDMQLISEIYELLKEVGGASCEELAKIFSEWNQGELESYLIEIVAKIFQVKEGSGFLVDQILDVAGQKGTGKWTAISGFDLGVPVPLVAEAVFARALSALKEERGVAAKHYPKKTVRDKHLLKELAKEAKEALFAAKVISYAQGFMLMRCASKEMGWNLNYGEIALLWRGGCIIRSAFLGKIEEAFRKNKDLPSLLLDPFFETVMKEKMGAMRRVAVKGIEAGIAMPCITSALSFFDGYSSNLLPANLLQAMRDFFGAHTYERIDRPRGEFFHTNWTGHGGSVSSTTYNV